MTFRCFKLFIVFEALEYLGQDIFRNADIFLRLQEIMEGHFGDAWNAIEEINPDGSVN